MLTFSLDKGLLFLEDERGKRFFRLKDARRRQWAIKRFTKAVEDTAEKQDVSP